MDFRAFSVCLCIPDIFWFYTFIYCICYKHLHTVNLSLRCKTSTSKQFVNSCYREFAQQMQTCNRRITEPDCYQADHSATQYASPIKKMHTHIAFYEVFLRKAKQKTNGVDVRSALNNLSSF